MSYFANTATGEVISSQEMISAHPNTIFPIPFEPVDGYELLDETLPSYDPETQKLIYSETAYEIGGKWSRTITIIDLAEEDKYEIKQSKVPHTVTMRQARLALLSAGLLNNVEAAIESLPSPQREEARIEWEYAQEVHRHVGIVIALAGILGVSEPELDDLFILAAEK